MKIKSLFRRLTVLSLFVLIIFSIETNAQQDQAENRPKPILIASGKSPEITRPRIIVAKKTAISRVPAKEEQKLKPTDFKLEKKTFELINEKRKESGLEPVKWNDKIAELARQHSENMAKFSFFSHIGLNGRTVDQRALDFGIIKWSAISENIAYNKGFENPSEFAVERWMISDVHRRNLLDSRWKESAVGIAVSEDGAYFFTQIFLVK